jgi:Ni,Fe-hydrogenase maturation factor
MRRPLPGFSVMVRHQLTPEIAEPLSQASHALFVDVRVPDGDSAVCLDRLDAAADAGPVGHAMHPADLLALAQALYGHAPDAWILSLPSEDLGLGDQISSRAAQGVRRGVLAARRLADRLGYGVET